MPVQPSEIIAYGSATMPEDDTTTNIGGGIDVTTRVVFTDIPSTGNVVVYSTDGGDTTQTVTVTGRDASGQIVSESLGLNGTTPVAGTQQFERILKIVLSAAATGTVYVEDNVSPTTVLAALEPGVTQVRRIFYNASADAAGGSVKKYYEKVFIKNTNATLALLSATIAEQADPSGKIAFALESTLNGTDTNGTGNNRLVAPAGYTFDNTTKSVAGGDLTPGDAQGVWLELTLNPGDAAQKTTYTLRTSGRST